MTKQKTPSKRGKPFFFPIGERTFTVKKAVKLIGKDGKPYYLPIEESQIMLAFVDERTNKAIGPVDLVKNKSWKDQLLDLYVDLLKKAKNKKKNR